MEKPKLFGTDGVRGVAGEFPLDRETVAKLGQALGVVLHRTNSRSLRVVLGEDTRASSAWIARILAKALAAESVEVIYAGVMTTPGVAYLTRALGASGGVVVSASHNPYQDNGVKVLSSSGMKLPEMVELEIERELERSPAQAESDGAFALETLPELAERYVEHLRSLIPRGLRFPRLHVVVDCAQGAASRVAPPLLEALGLKARFLNALPDGRNINQECGSLYPEVVAKAVKEGGADLGVAFDGDADRAIFATADGKIADGDHVLYAAALRMQSQGELKGPAVVGTLMTNLGLEQALGERGIALRRTPVGDKYVLEEMLRSCLNLGGEPSGHIIFGEISYAGDGLITLLQVLRLMAESGQPLASLVEGLVKFPQLIRNVRVREKRPLESVKEVQQALADCQREMGARGRIVLRYSGTEPLARVMVEAEWPEMVERHAARIAGVIQTVLGVG